MGYIARARTGEDGREVYGPTVNYADMQAMRKPTFDWTRFKKETKPSRLGALFNLDRFSLLARYLHRDRGYLANSYISYGSDNKYVYVSITDRKGRVHRFAARGQSIFEERGT